MTLTLHTAALLVFTSAFGLMGLMYLGYVALCYPAKPRVYLGITWLGIIPSTLQKLYGSIPASLPVGTVINKIIAEKVNGEAILVLLTPDIEKHVDRFLQEKMKEAFPMLYPLMGEKTILKFKAAFMEEIALILPAIIEKFAASLQFSPDAQLNTSPFLPLIPLDKIQHKVLHAVQHRLAKLLLAAFFVGLLLGILQCGILYFFS